MLEERRVFENSKRLPISAFVSLFVFVKPPFRFHYPNKITVIANIEVSYYFCPQNMHVCSQFTIMPLTTKRRLNHK